MTDEQLRLIGLGLRAGKVIVGTEGVRNALQRTALPLVVVAKDASVRTKEKVVRLAERKGVRTVIGPSAVSLGKQLGRPAVQAVGVRDRNIARAIGA